MSTGDWKAVVPSFGHQIAARRVGGYFAHGKNFATAAAMIGW
jgi:hypothetical protein